MTPYPPVDDSGVVASRRCALCSSPVVKVDAVLCVAHFTEQRRQAVYVKLAEHQGDAIDVMYDLAMNASSEAVRQSAARDLLDRAGLRRGVEVEVTTNAGQSPAEVLRERLARLRAATVVEGEVLGDD